METQYLCRVPNDSKRRLVHQSEATSSKRHVGPLLDAQLCDGLHRRLRAVSRRRAEQFEFKLSTTTATRTRAGKNYVFGEFEAVVVAVVTMTILGGRQLVLWMKDI